MTFKTFMEKNQHLLGKLLSENWPKCASEGCSRYICPDKMTTGVQLLEFWRHIMVCFK